MKGSYSTFFIVFILLLIFLKEAVLPIIIHPVFIAIVVFLLCIFLIYLSLPLNNNEVEKLSKSRREKDIKKYYSFISIQEPSSCLYTSKELIPGGGYYLIDEFVNILPAYIAYLLKYKKHQWSVVGFERGQRAEMIWTNKGKDRGRTSLLLSPIAISKQIKGKSYQTIFFFRNYPNPDAYYYNNDDFVMEMNRYVFDIKDVNVNYLGFVCKKGCAEELIFERYSDDFYPIVDYISSISKENGRSIYNNMILKMEYVRC